MKIQEIVEQYYGAYAERCPEKWQGYDVYLVCKDETTGFGRTETLPVFILVKDGKYHVTYGEIEDNGSEGHEVWKFYNDVCLYTDEAQFMAAHFPNAFDVEDDSDLEEE